MILTDESGPFLRLIEEVGKIKKQLEDISGISIPTPTVAKGVWLIHNETNRLMRLDEDCYNRVMLCSYRPATEEEIQKHLVTEAKKRGFRTGARVNCEDGISRIVDNESLFYNKLPDRLCCSVKKGLHYTIATALYARGRWVDIIPPKKPIPKTKKELAEFLGSYICDNVRDGKKAAEFLSEYED